MKGRTTEVNGGPLDAAQSSPLEPRSISAHEIEKMRLKGHHKAWPAPEAWTLSTPWTCKVAGRNRAREPAERRYEARIMDVIDSRKISRPET
jgi:hypothetical protein